MKNEEADALLDKMQFEEQKEILLQTIRQNTCDSLTKTFAISDERSNVLNESMKAKMLEAIVKGSENVKDPESFMTTTLLKLMMETNNINEMVYIAFKFGYTQGGVEEMIKAKTSGIDFLLKTLLGI